MFGCVSLGLALLVACTALSAPSAGDESVDAYAELLDRYVTGAGLVRYDAWRVRPADLDRLGAVVDALEARVAEHPERLGTWIDLYNAATLELVLTSQPVASIREISGPGGSPWAREVVEVAGDSLSLDEIEHDVIRARFDDARVHFALNCASLGCPPLAHEPYARGDLDERLEAATRRALADERWVSVDGATVTLSPIFDWFREDFSASAGSIAGFLRAHAPGELRLPASPELRFGEYDWRLNRAPGPR